MNTIKKVIVGGLVSLSIIVGGSIYLGNIGGEYRGQTEGRKTTVEEIRSVAKRFEYKLNDSTINLNVDQRKYFLYFSNNLSTIANIMDERNLGDSSNVANNPRLQELERALLRQCEMIKK
ncbi:MAG: hypothetical protein WC238_06205 [Parcubacteria group bacterium]|jgi:hypothetical protein